MNMIYYIISFFLATVCVLLAVMCLNPEKLHSVWLLRSKDESVEIYHKMDVKKRWIIALGIGLLTAAASWRMFVLTQQTVDQVRFAVAIVCLTGSGCADWTEHRIPNVFPLAIVLSSFVLLGVEAFRASELASARLIGCLIAGGASLLCLVLLALLSQRGVGAGDIKLVSSLGLLLGIRPLYWTILLTMILCAAGAAYLLITRKKTLKQTIAFGPFVFAGYCLAAVCGLLIG